MKRLMPAVLFAGAVAVQSCTTSSEPSSVRALGLVLEGTPPMTSLGSPFQVTVSTFGSSSCTRPDGYTTVATAARIEVRPYDINAAYQSACTDDLGRFPRVLLLQFDQPGTAEVVVIGRGTDGNHREIHQAITVLP
jgi:hypothetical protein